MAKSDQKIIISLLSPRICPIEIYCIFIIKKKPHDVEDNDSFDVRQVDDLAVDLELNIFSEVFGEAAPDHLLQRDLDVDGLVVKAGVEFVRLVLALGVEGVTQVGVQTDTEVVVHDKDLEN